MGPTEVTFSCVISVSAIEILSEQQYVDAVAQITASDWNRPSPLRPRWGSKHSEGLGKRRLVSLPHMT